MKLSAKVNSLFVLFYLFVVYLFFFRGVFSSPQLIYGNGGDPLQYVWFFSWWNYAFTHPVSLFITDKVWPPSGYNLTQATSLLGAWLLSLPFQPFTSAANALNSVALLTTALAGWTMHLFCYRLTKQYVPSMIGGLLFCFSGYMVAHLLGHLNLTGSVFLLPLLLYLVWLYLHDLIKPFWFILFYAICFSLFFLISSELAFTSLFAGALAFLCAIWIFDHQLVRLRSVLLCLALAYVLSAIIVSPYLYYFFFYHSTGAIYGSSRGNDLLGLFLPTSIFMMSTSWTQAIARHFLMNLSEQNAYLGLPLIVAVCWFVVTNWRTKQGKFFVVMVTVFLFFSVGDAFFVGGNKWMNNPIPRLFYKYVPLFHSILLSRLALYAELVICIMMALWLARVQGKARAVLLGLLIVALLFLLPSMNRDHFSRYTAYEIPQFFTSQDYKRYLVKDARVLLISKSQGEVLLTQAYTDFYFVLTVAYLGRPPEQYMNSIGDAKLYANKSELLESKEIWEQFSQMITYQNTQFIVVTDDVFSQWQSLLSRLGIQPIQVDDVMIYPLYKEFF